MARRFAAKAQTADVFAIALREILPDLRERYNVSSLGLFGSYVRGEQTPRSDLDLLVEFDVAPSLFTYIDLRDELSHRLGVSVDLVMKTALRPHIGRRILAEVIPV
ncbi:MAG: hypothetical protein EPO26_13895 [Chloroflexota bacterium]|nr:MAG: hypothetical protein EPO26_13895 [Chloroflexota bacterium]